MDQPSSVPGDVTLLLSAWKGGDRAALDALIPVVFTELQRIARAYLAREPRAQTLQTSDLVNEAFLRLAGVYPSDWESRKQFFALAARLMRNILVDHSRAKHGPKRGGEFQRVALEDALHAASSNALTDLDMAMIGLEKEDPRKCHLVELRLFAGLSNEEAADVLGVSPRTIVRDWQYAKAWLARELSRSEQ